MSVGALTTKKLEAISDLIRLPRQYGTLLVLWPTLWSLFIAAGGTPSLKLLAIFVVGTFLMRSAGCAINDIADRNFDPYVDRTRARPLPSGRLSVKEAVAVFLLLDALAFALVLFLNPLTVALSVVGLLLASVYPFVKRVSHWPQAFLGMAFGWGAVMAWAASKNSVDAVPVLIFMANVFWSTAYDTIYALMDREDDLKIGVKSTAILFSNRVYAALTALYIAFAAALSMAGLVAGMGLIYYAGVFISLVALLWVVKAVSKNPDARTAFNGFIANAAAGGVILLAVILDTNL